MAVSIKIPILITVLSALQVKRKKILQIFIT